MSREWLQSVASDFGDPSRKVDTKCGRRSCGMFVINKTVIVCSRAGTNGKPRCPVRSRATRKVQCPILLEVRMLSPNLDGHLELISATQACTRFHNLKFLPHRSRALPLVFLKLPSSASLPTKCEAQLLQIHHGHAGDWGCHDGCPILWA